MNAFQLAEATAHVRRRYDGLKVGYPHYAEQDGGGVHYDANAVRVLDEASGWYFEAHYYTNPAHPGKWGVLLRDRWDRLEQDCAVPGEEAVFLAGFWSDMYAAIDAGVAYYRDGVGDDIVLPTQTSL